MCYHIKVLKSKNTEGRLIYFCASECGIYHKFSLPVFSLPPSLSHFVASDMLFSSCFWDLRFCPSVAKRNSAVVDCNVVRW
ncbi:hypothetical protein FF1_034278 [Malus domestica]